MQRDIEWDKKRNELVRNMFVSLDPNFATVPQEPTNGTNSSEDLPDLLIEPEPNKHDDPPEVYEKLKERCTKLYGILFTGEHDSSTERMAEELIPDYKEAITPKNHDNDKQITYKNSTTGTAKDNEYNGTERDEVAEKSVKRIKQSPIIPLRYAKRYSLPKRDIHGTVERYERVSGNVEQNLGSDVETAGIEEIQPDEDRTPEAVRSVRRSDTPNSFENIANVSDRDAVTTPETYVRRSPELIRHDLPDDIMANSFTERRNSDSLEGFHYLPHTSTPRRLVTVPQVPTNDTNSSEDLPELLIEPEPNKHDDPPEVYEKLKERCTKLYGILFSGEHDSSTERMAEELIPDYKEAITPKNHNDKQITDKNTSTDKDNAYIDEEKSVTSNGEFDFTNKSSDSKTDQKSSTNEEKSSDDNSIELHTSDREEMEEAQENGSNSNGTERNEVTEKSVERVEQSPIIPMRHAKRYSLPKRDIHGTVERYERVSGDVEQNLGSDVETPGIEEIQPDEDRTPEAVRSVRRGDTPRSFENIAKVSDRDAVTTPDTNVRHRRSPELIRHDLPDDIMASSFTEKRIHDSLEGFQHLPHISTPRRRKRKSFDDEHDVHKKKKYEDAETQTAEKEHDETEDMWEEFFRSRIFAGPPTIYVPCSCKKHTCS